MWIGARRGGRTRPSSSRVGHDEAADQAGADAPRGLPDVLDLARLGLELDVEGLAEVLAEIVAGAGLQGLAVLHHRLDAEGLERARELLVVGLLAADHRHRQHLFGEVAVDVEHLQDLGHRLVVAGVGGVALLPEELGGAQEEAGAHLPAHHVGPLVDEQRQVAVAVDPVREEVADDRLGGRADDVGLVERLAAGVGDDGELGREALDVLGLLGDEALGDEQREVGVLVAGGLEAGVEVPLDPLPDRVAVRLDDHAALDHLGRLGHLGLADDVLVPLGVVVGPQGDLSTRLADVLLVLAAGLGLHAARGCRGRGGQARAAGVRRHKSGGRWLGLPTRRSELPVVDHGGEETPSFRESVGLLDVGLAASGQSVA